MIPHNLVFSAIWGITGVAVHNMMWLDICILFCHHQQCGNRSHATCTRCQMVNAKFLVVKGGVHKCFYLSCHDAIFGKSIYNLCILVCRIVREVAADNKKILLIQVGLQGISNLLQGRQFLRGNDDRNNGWYLFHVILQEWQFHLQAMLALMCFWSISNSITLFHKVFTESGIYRNISQRSGIGRSTYIY